MIFLSSLKNEKIVLVIKNNFNSLIDGYIRIWTLERESEERAWNSR